MQNKQWHKINDVFSGWLDRKGDEQNRFLNEAFGNDESLRKKVQLLIDEH
jgi:hypothetical protein